MKLSALNSAIRALDGAPKVNMRYWRDETFEVKLSNLQVTKQSLLDALKESFPQGRNHETHLILIDGVLSRDDATWPISDEPPADEPVVSESQVEIDEDPLGLGVLSSPEPAAAPAASLDDLFG